MKFAEVSVNSPAARRRTFSYSIPEGLPVVPGQAVLVPFGQRELQGIVLELTPFPAVAETREIIGIIEPKPVLAPVQIALAKWISDHYLAPLFDALALMLPPGFERRAITYISLEHAPADLSTLGDDEKKVLTMLSGHGRINLEVVEKQLGKKKARAVLGRLLRQGIVARSCGLSPERLRPHRETQVSLREAGKSTEGLSPRQARLVNYLMEKGGSAGWAEVRKATVLSREVLRTLEEKGLVTCREIEVVRDPISYENIVPSRPLELNADQQAALAAIKAALEVPDCGQGRPQVFLLHGVTGSGKTEVYLQALAEAVRLGKKGIVLVPEIALTPQTIERFASRFPHRVAVLHSRLSPGEQYDEWHRIRRGEFDVVIGSRSAIFAPQPDLGLIIIDEEHEWTYKQETSPRYRAGDVAEKLAGLTGAVLVLGSATPSVESYYRACAGDYKLLHLPERVVPVSGAPLPAVEVVDMREELKSGNQGVFSRALSQAIEEALGAGEQVILFLNRRGGATFIQCRRCGYVWRCRRCDTPLTQHPAENLILCHQCNYRLPLPQFCPQCRSPRLKFLGIGTQRLEEEVRQHFPRARFIRWDSDVTTPRRSHEAILQKFRQRQAEILIGTQMVAKGLDIPSVTLVGVVSADTSLHLPDFRAGERTFQLLNQVAGRAGRGTAGGRVIIQTFSPEHYAVQAAAKYDYTAFYEREIAFRREFREPPFAQLARLVYVFANEARCREEAERMKRLLEADIEARGIENIEIIGPAPAFIRRLRGRYRWQLILRGQGLSSFLSNFDLPAGWTVDIDPINVVK